ncbi:MAG: LpxI family protein [Planctomycetes bacterium]|nr:LpxI family protein [Planctomycetota bacterium]
MNALHCSDAPLLAGETIGILAGWGRYPVLVAEAIRRRGGRTAILAIRDHADAVLEPLADVHGNVGVAEIGKAIDFFRRAGARRATMAGKIHKSRIFARSAWVRHLPDWTGLTTFWPHFVSRRRDNRDDSLLGAITAAFDSFGVAICPATDFAPDLLAGDGLLAGPPPTGRQLDDVSFGWRLAKELGRLDIGQTVVVRNRAPLALEAIEGTDECIRRAGRLCPAGGMTVVKVAKPGQDLRFDMPTIGVGTLESLAAAGAITLAIEAGQTILIDEPAIVAAARRLGISIVSCHDREGVPLVDAAALHAA